MVVKPKANVGDIVVITEKAAGQSVAVGERRRIYAWHSPDGSPCAPTGFTVQSEKIEESSKSAAYWWLAEDWYEVVTRAENVKPTEPEETEPEETWVQYVRKR